MRNERQERREPVLELEAAVLPLAVVAQTAVLDAPQLVFAYLTSLAVQNSSIGDLVTDLLTHTLSRYFYF